MGKNWVIKDKPYMVQSEDVFIYDYYNSKQTLAAGYYGSLLNFNQYDDFVNSMDTYTGNPLFSFASYKEGNNLHIWVAGDGMTVLHYLTSVTYIRDKQNPIVKSFSFSQNYPNPFNPTTKIKYRIPLSPPLLKGEGEAGGFVTLKVYDILGNEIATLVNKEQSSGEYEVEFDAGKYNLSSGIYFYQIKTQGFISTKKMILLR